MLPLGLHELLLLGAEGILPQALYYLIQIFLFVFHFLFNWMYLQWFKMLDITKIIGNKPQCRTYVSGCANCHKKTVTKFYCMY